MRTLPAKPLFKSPFFKKSGTKNISLKDFKKDGRNGNKNISLKALKKDGRKRHQKDYVKCA
jgi:hypothetical protein